MKKPLYLFTLVAFAAIATQAQTYPARGLDYNQLPGTTYSASSELLPGYPAASAFQGDRIGQNCAFVNAADRCYGRAPGAGWADNTPGVTPDWLRAVWDQPHSVRRFVVAFFQDNFSTPRIEPYAYLRVGADYTVEKFDVQILTMEGGWLTVASVDENYFVLREVVLKNAVTAKGCQILIHETGPFDRSIVHSWEAYRQ